MLDALDQVRAEALTEAPVTPIAVAPGAPPGAPLALDPAAVDRAEAEAWAQLPAVAGSILCMAMPELREAYAPEACGRWGEAMMHVAKRLKWTFAMIGPYLGLAVATVPIAVPTYVAVRVHAKKAAGGAPPPRAAETAPPSSPASSGIQKVKSLEEGG